MKPLTTLCVMLVACAIALPAFTQEAQGTEENWRSLKREAKRQKIAAEADFALKKVLTTNTKAQELYDISYGWAMFKNVKVAFIFSGGGGNGVAVNKGTGEHTYMKVGTVGVGFGLGVNKYKVVFLFQDEATFASFVNKGWQADAGASAVAGTAGAEVKTGFVNGIAIYQLTDKGLMAAADVSGTKYWKNKKLNK
jgi:lipid-binding SYLF domain-containing protein